MTEAEMFFAIAMVLLILIGMGCVFLLETIKNTLKDIYNKLKGDSDG